MLTPTCVHCACAAHPPLSWLHMSITVRIKALLTNLLCSVPWWSVCQPTDMTFLHGAAQEAVTFCRATLSTFPLSHHPATPSPGSSPSPVHILPSPS